MGKWDALEWYCNYVGVSESELKAAAGNDVSVILEFTKDGKVIGTATAAGRSQSFTVGDYTIKGDKLIVDGQESTYSIKGDKLTIKDKSMTATLTRTK